MATATRTVDWRRPLRAAAIASALAASASCTRDDERPAGRASALTTLAHDERLRRSDALDDPDARAALAAGVDAALAADPAGLPVTERIVLGNDLWGVYQRATADGQERIETAPLAASIARLVARLALDPDDLARLAPPPIASALPGSGWIERGTELDELAHEQAFGRRRVFHIMTRDGDRERALVQTVVALDTSGQAHDSGIVGGIERIAPRAGDVVVEVRERDPRAAGGFTAAVAIAALPLGGANHSLLDLAGDTAAVTPTLCMRCHAGDRLRGGPGVTLNSLPVSGDPRPRQRALLARATADAALMLASTVGHGHVR